ncbi:MAG TPA: hypothetical protein VFR32_09300 [Gaiellaceae bacterium]|nr:hypothetical protein [Gaiellaceae bacterium]
MRESPYLAEIRRVDPVRDHVRIVHLDACYGPTGWRTSRDDPSRESS